jgi:hypothetical protein
VLRCAPSITTDIEFGARQSRTAMSFDPSESGRADRLVCQRDVCPVGSTWSCGKRMARRTRGWWLRQCFGGVRYRGQQQTGRAIRERLTRKSVAVRGCPGAPGTSPSTLSQLRTARSYQFRSSVRSGGSKLAGARGCASRRRSRWRRPFPTRCGQRSGPEGPGASAGPRG